MNIGRDAVFSPKASVILMFAWLAFVAAMFATNWHPFLLMSRMLPLIPQDVIAGLMRLLRYGVPDLAMLCLFVIAAIGGGSLILGSFKLDIDRGQKLTLSFGLGLAALSYLTLFLGIAGGFNNTGLIVVIVAIALMAVNGLLFIVRSLKGFSTGFRVGWIGILFFALLLVIGVFLAAKALRPAVFYDAVTYHLGVPNYYLQEGGIGYIPYDSYSNFPLAAEMLYTLGMFVSGLGLAQLTSVAVFMALAMLVYEFTRSFLPEVPPAIPAAFCLLTPAFMEAAVLYTNDLHLAYFSLLAVYCFFAIERDGNRAWLALMGIFTGVCIGTKYIALVSICVPASLAVGYIVYRDRAKGPRAALKTVLMFALPAAAVASPWLIKNWAYTGNPFYPALYGMFGGEDMTEALYAVHAAAAGHTTLADGARGLMAHPWELFMASPADTVEKYGAASMIGPVLILFVPILIAVRGVHPSVKKMCLYAAALFIMWSMAFPLTRFLYPAVAVMIVVASYALTSFVRSAPGMAKAFMVAAVAVCLTFDMCLGFYQVDKWTGAYGFEYMDEAGSEYIVRRAEDGGTVMLQAVPVYEWINEHTPEDARVLIIGDAQHLYIDRRHLYTYLSAKNPYEVFSSSGIDADAVVAYLRSEGVTHIVYYPGELRRLQKSGYTSYPEKDDARIDDFLRSGNVRLVSASRLYGRPVYGFELE